MKSKMKSQIFIFFICVYCLNIVASYHQYLDYHNKAYPQRPDWSNNQDYPQNQNPVYALHQPAVNYGPLKHVANYAHSPSEAKNAQYQAANFPEQKQEPIYVQLQEASEQQRQQIIEESSAKIQSETNYAEQPPASLPQTYQEAPKSYSDILDRSYGIGPQIWQQAPHANLVYRPDGYPQQVSRQWPQSSHIQTVPSIPQEPYPRPMAYWQSSGYQNVPQHNNYYGGSSYEKPIYNTPVQSQTRAQTTADSANNFRELLASNPKVKEYMASQNKRFLLIHPNGMTEHVDVLDESLLGNSQHFKSSDIFIEEDIPAKIKEKDHQYLVDNQIGSATHNISDSHNANRNLNVPLINDFEPLRSNFSKEIKPITEAINEDTKKYYPKLSQIHNYKENHNADSSILSADKPITNNNHRYNPVFRHPKRPYENSVHEQNIPSVPLPPMSNYDSNYVNPSEPQESKTHIIERVKKSEDKEYVSPLYEENNGKYSESKYFYPVQTNSESNSNSSSSKTVRDTNNHQNTTVDSSPSNDQSNYHNSSGGSYSDTPSQAIYYANIGVPNETNKTTITLPYFFQTPPKDTDTINNTVHPTFETPKKSDYDEISYIIYNQNDDIGLNVGDVNSATDRSNIDVTTDYMENQDNLNFENTNLADVYGTIDETDNVQRTNYERVNDNDNQQSNVGFEYSDSYLSSTTADEITTLPPAETESVYCEYCAAADEDQTKFPVKKGSPYCEYCATDEDQTNSDENLPEQPEIMYLTEETNSEEINPGDIIGEHVILVADFTDLKTATKPSLSFRLPEQFWDKLSLESDLEDVYVVDLKFLNPIIERVSKSVSQNGTTIEEIEETVWEHKDDILPRQRRFTKIITYPGPEQDGPQKNKSDETEDAVVPKCKP